MLISSVSGGSTGAYYYLDQFGLDKQGNPKKFDAASALRNSSASSLGAAAWGLTYPDFARTLPIISSLISAQSDRGDTLEKAWIYNHGSKDTLANWIDETSKGQRPAVIFNATGVETGQPVLFGTTSLSPGLPLFPSSNDQSLEQQFLLTFPQTDLAVSTAARMSATFPYVSPEARPAKSILDDYNTTTPPLSQLTFCSPHDAWDATRLHVADGGLFDNTGVVSAAHWIFDLWQDPKAPHPPIILLMITSPYQEKPGASWSWQHQLLGPVETLLHVRTGSQHVRRNLEAQLLATLASKAAGNPQATAAKNPSITQNPAKPADPAKTPPPFTILRFCNATDPNKQTLSWHLTSSQSEALQKTWNDDYGKDNAANHAEVAALVHLLDPAKPEAAPTNTCPAFPPRTAK